MDKRQRNLSTGRATWLFICEIHTWASIPLICFFPGDEERRSKASPEPPATEDQHWSSRSINIIWNTIGQ